MGSTDVDVIAPCYDNADRFVRISQTREERRGTGRDQRSGCDGLAAEEAIDLLVRNISTENE